MTTEEPRPAPDRPGPDEPGPGEPGPDEPGPGEPGPGEPGPGEPVPGERVPGEPGADHGAPAPLGASEISRLAAGSTRRAPRFGRFIGVGVLAGLALAAVITLLGPSGPVLGRDAVFLLLAVGFGTAGALLGALGAVIAERRPR